MKSKIIILMLGVFLSFLTAQSQTIVFSEDFETLPLSVTSSGTSNWARSTTLSAGGSYSDTAVVTLSGNTYLTSPSFSTLGNYMVQLQFDQICKIEFFDGGFVEYSIDNGSTWNVVSSAYYLGSGTMASNKFTANSYTSTWMPADMDTMPNNTWWKHETFDIGSLVGNQASVMIRFRLSDLNNTGPNMNYGWALDNISVSMALSETTPPAITQLPTIWQDTVYQTGPFAVKAKISDMSGIDTAYVVYTVNGGSNIYLGMNILNVDTFGVTIPSQAYNTRIDYSIIAVDGSIAANADTSAARWFYTKQAPPVVIIGTGTSTTNNVPFYGLYDYGWSASLYSAAEIGNAGFIDSLFFYVGNTITAYTIHNQYLLLSTVPDTEFPDGAMPDSASTTTFFSGSITWAGPGWFKFTAATPFYYNGTDNLLVHWRNRSGAAPSGYPNFQYTSTTPVYKAKYVQNDTYSSVFPTSSATRTYNRPNLKIAFALSTTVHDVAAVEISAPDDTPLPTTGTPYDLKVKIKNIGSDTLTSVLLNWDLNGVVQTPFAWNGMLLQDETSAEITMASVTFPSAGNHTIKFWTTNPDGFADELPLNDTVSKLYFACSAPLAGTYTIGTSGDFTTIGQAAIILNNCGVSGPVVFNIANGTYNEQVNLTSIAGASSVNTITFQSSSGNYNDVVVVGGGEGASTNFVFNLDGTDYVRIKNITLQASGSNTGFTTALNYTNGANFNIFTGNRFLGIENTTSTSAYNAVIYSPSGTTSIDTNNVFIGNLVEYGSYGFYINGGSSSALEIGNTFSKNRVINAGYRGMALYYLNAFTADSNVIISHPSSSTSFYGIYSYYSDNAIRITRNTITNQNSGYGLNVYYCDAVVGNEGLIANNMIFVTGTATSYGIYDYYTNNQKFYYNSVNVTSNSTTARAAYVVGSTTTTINNDFVNNIFAYTGVNTSGMAIYVSTTQMVGTMNYNNHFSTGTNLGYWGANRTTLALWQGASGKDANSVSVNPGFFSATNLHTSSPLLFAKGTALALVTNDIDNDLRAAIPCIGADEFIMYNKNIAINNILAPVTGCALSSAETITIRVSNSGLDNITSFDAYYVLNNGTPVHEVVTATILPLATYDYSFTTKADLSAYGNYEIDAYVTQAGEQITSNDTINNYTFYNGWDFSNSAYTMGFEPTEYFGDWSTINGDAHASYKWILPYSGSTYSHTGTYSAQFYNGTTNTGEDWLFTRCFPFEAGKTYEISFWYRAYNTSSPQTLTLKMGTAPASAAMTTTLTSLVTFTNATHQQSVTRFTVPTSGSYYLGWLGQTGLSNYAYVDDINISEIPEQEASLLGIESPVSSCGLTNAETVMISIENIGADTINANLTAYYQVNGGSIVSENVPQTILTGDTLDFSFASTIDMSVTTQDSSFNILTWISLTGDTVHSNDTISANVYSFHTPVEPVVTNDTIPYGTSATLTAVAADSVLWFADIATGTSFYNGQVYTTPLLTDTTTYFVEARNQISYNYTFDTNLQGWTPLTPCSYTTYSWAWASDGGTGAAWITDPAVYSSSILMSPAVNTFGKNFSLSFRHRYSTEINYDNGYVAYRVDGGAWQHLALTTGVYNATDNLGTDPVLASCVAGPSVGVFSGSNNTYFNSTGTINVNNGNQLELAFVFSSDNSGGSTGWYIDNVELTSVFCSSSRVPVTAVVLPPAAEFEMAEIISPVSGCTDGVDSVKIKFYNSGADTLDIPFNVSYQINNNAPVTETVNYIMLAGDSMIHTFMTPISLPLTSGDTTFSFKAWGELAVDFYNINDSLSGTVSRGFTPPAPVTMNDTVPYGTMATLGATSPYSINWYSQPYGGTEIGSGSTFTTPVLYANTSFYAMSQAVSNAFIGPIDNSIGAGGYVNYTTYVVYFDVLNALGATINSVDVFSNAAVGSAYTIFVKDNNGVQVATYSGNTTLTGVSETIPVGFTLPAGSNYSIGFSTMPNMYRNTAGASYPYSLPGEISITGHSFSGYPAYYYYFYNWNVTSGGCESAPVEAKAVVTGQPDLDAGVVSILSPSNIIPLGTENVEIELINFGLDTLTSVDIAWTVNGTLQSPFHWTGSLLTGEKDTVVIGSYLFDYTPYPGLNDLVAWTESPNALADTFNVNDTAAAVIDAHEPYNGTYYIQTATPDFSSFTTAVAALSDWGVDGPVTILAANGTYNESFVVQPIPGANSTNTISFGSLSGINTDVVLEFTNTSAQNYIVKLDSADYITFRDMTMRSTASATYGRVIELANGANYNRFENNILQGVDGSSNTAAVIYSGSTGVETGNVFMGNTIDHGYYSVYFYGSTTNHKLGNYFVDNTITNFEYYGIYLYYNDSARVIGNNLSNIATASTNYHMYLGYMSAGSRVENNTIVGSGTSTFYGIYLYYNNTTETNPNLIANNFVSQIGSSMGTAYGIYCSYSNYLNIYYNSVNIAAGSASAGRALYQTSGTSNINIVNNNLANTSGGYALYIGTSGVINTIDYNNLYTNGPVLAYWGADRADLITLQTISAKNMNSVSITPGYYSATDLHTYQFALRNATALAAITTDIDGELRDGLTPTIGADEYVPFATDAGIVKFDQPALVSSAGINDVSITLANYGTNTLTSANIAWTLDGSLQTPFVWNGSIAFANETDSIVIGTANLLPGVHYFSAWPEMPNGAADMLNLNDTAKYTIVTCDGGLAGTYTIGASGDFATFAEAVLYASTCGIDNVVVFEVQTGLYEETVSIPALPGASAVNTVTFTSQSGTPSDVVLQPAATQTDYSIVSLNNTSYVSWKNMTIDATSFSTVRGITINDICNGITIDGNVINLPDVSTGTTNVTGIYDAGILDTNLVIKNNVINDGSYGIYIYGSGTASLQPGTVISGNTVSNYSYYGIRAYYLSAPVIEGNYVFADGNTYSTLYGLYAGYCDNGLQLTGNKIVLPAIMDGYGLYLYYNDGLSTAHSLVANNFVSMQGGNATTATYAVYASTNTYLDFVFNSVNLYDTYASSKAFYVAAGSNITVKNNIIAAMGGAFAIHFTTTTAVTESDYNNLYSSGSVLGYYSVNQADLAAWQTASSKDANSISTDPLFISNNDLHVYLASMNAAATPIAVVTTDIDGEIRDLTTPDIGADEFTPLNVNLGITHILKPVNDFGLTSSQDTVKIRIFNFGATTATSFTVGYKLNGTVVSSQTWSGTLLMGTATEYEFATLFTPQAGWNNLEIFVSIAGDGDLSNDTATAMYKGVPELSIPYADDFETNDFWGTNTTPDGWEFGIPASTVINCAYSPDLVWKTNLDGVHGNNQTVVLYSPVFSFINAYNAQLSFYHWFDTDTLDGGYIQYTANGGTTWNNLGTLNDPTGTNWAPENVNTGYGWSGHSGGWVQSSIDLSFLNFNPFETQFRFIFFSNSIGTNGDGWAIDNFEIIIPQANIDAGVVEIVSPAGTLTPGIQEPITVKIVNFGTSTLTSIPVVAKANTGQPPMTGTWTGSVASGDTVTFTFPTNYTPVAVSDFELCAYTDMTTDYLVFNDTTCVALTTNVGINDNSMLGISLNPNPADDFSILEFESLSNESAVLSITSNDGKQVREMVINTINGANSIRIETADLAPGLYHWNLNSSTGSKKGKLMIVR